MVVTQRSVDSYIRLDRASIATIVETRNLSKIQGNNILIEYGTYDKNILLDFLGLTLNNVNKIVIEKGVRLYYLVAKQLDFNMEEPFPIFSVYENIDRAPEAIVDVMFDNSL